MTEPVEAKMGYSQEETKSVEARRADEQALLSLSHGQTSGMHYQKIPHEAVEFTMEPSVMYPENQPGTVEVALHDLGRWIASMLNRAAQEGHLARTARHFAAQMDGVMDSQLLMDFRRVTDEIWKNRFDDAALERGRREMIELAGTIKVKRRGK